MEFVIQVKTWFQNRRMKHKKQLRKGSESGTTKSGSKSCGSVSSGNGTDSEDKKGSNGPTLRLDNGTDATNVIPFSKVFRFC
jgi:hypothetical protein